MSSLPALTAAASVAAAGLAWAALAPQSQLFGPTLIAPDRPNEIALTYDDGPNPAATPRLLEVLAHHDVRATFFLIGRFVRTQPTLVREIAAAGHLIGNHSTTHPWLPFISNARIRAELTGCNAALEDTLGAPVRYFRAPHGARRPYVLKTARRLGLTPVQWNIICGDWNPIGRDAILARATRGIARNQRDGRASNIVLHDGGHLALNAPRMATVEATDRLLQQLPPSQVSYVTVDAWA
ncbi:polysaccharide deacetylase family protein [Edaphobacter bradus]|uniref:polysaccharide deacetylase family protein n=1 Tax=Edaphobacter bradus TaxID=2259016 RepID=UPI0021DFC28F|nr:polysaccharide deacetylase family protein [Edaphobacter bradus]